MATKTKDQYISPKCEELDMNTEGVIAFSDPTVPGPPVVFPLPH